MNNCHNCKFLVRETESWEMPHIAWWFCRRKSSHANLTSFPFKKTKCKEFQTKESDR